MARYIDADKLVAWCNKTLQAQSTVEGKAYVNAFLEAVLGSTTADVVPRAEVAREIFAEIEKYVEVALMDGHIETPILCIGYSTFAQLKKKYTEEGK